MITTQREPIPKESPRPIAADSLGDPESPQWAASTTSIRWPPPQKTCPDSARFSWLPIHQIGGDGQPTGGPAGCQNTAQGREKPRKSAGDTPRVLCPMHRREYGFPARRDLVPDCASTVANATIIFLVSAVEVTPGGPSTPRKRDVWRGDES